MKLKPLHAVFLPGVPVSEGIRRRTIASSRLAVHLIPELFHPLQIPFAFLRRESRGARKAAGGCDDDRALILKLATMP